MAAPDLSVIIVSWNVRDLLRACLRSVLASQLPLEVIVVDNASADGTAAMVAQEFPQVRLIANAENRGFTAGNNQGIALAQGRYVFFLNPDTVVVGDALRTMIAYLDAHDDVGVVGPQLRYGDGRLQSSCRRFPTLWSALFESTPLEWHWPGNPWARRYRMEDRLPISPAGEETATPSPPLAGEETPHPFSPPLAGEGSGERSLPPKLGGPGGREVEVDWLVGAALMTRREVLEQVGGFDEGYFMYSEELDWCRRVRQAGWRIVYLPAAQVVHYEGKSSEQVVAARHIHFQTSKVRYFRKFHGPLAAAVLRVFLLGAFVAEWGLEALKWLLGSKRPLRRARMAAYAQLLQTGLRPQR